MADHSGGPAHGLQAFVFGRERIEHGVHIRLWPSGLRFVEQLTEQGLVISRKGTIDMAQTITLRQSAQNLELPADRLTHKGGTRATGSLCEAEMLKHLRRVV